MLGETTLIIGFAIDEHQGIFSHEKTDDGDWRYIQGGRRRVGSADFGMSMSIFVFCNHFSMMN